eukprot:4746225-Prymnesium_polylepis.1
MQRDPTPRDAPPRDLARDEGVVLADKGVCQPARVRVLARVQVRRANGVQQRRERRLRREGDAARRRAPRRRGRRAAQAAGGLGEQRDKLGE